MTHSRKTLLPFSPAPVNIMAFWNRQSGEQVVAKRLLHQAARCGRRQDLVQELVHPGLGASLEPSRPGAASWTAPRGECGCNWRVRGSRRPFRTLIQSEASTWEGATRGLHGEPVDGLIRLVPGSRRAEEGLDVPPRRGFPLGQVAAVQVYVQRFKAVEAGGAPP